MTDLSVEQLLQSILRDPDSKTPSISLADVKTVASHLGMPASRLSKSGGVDTIVEFLKARKDTIAAIEVLAPGALHQNRNVVARLINCVMKSGNSADQIMALSTRHQLQGSRINENSDFIVEISASFNDVQFDSGGVAFDHPILADAKIDPEFNRVTSKAFPAATRQQIWNWVKELRRSMRRCCRSLFCLEGINKDASRSSAMGTPTRLHVVLATLDGT
jgi:hypothetical protein